MEIASKDERYTSKDVGCKVINFSDEGKKDSTTKGKSKYSRIRLHHTKPGEKIENRGGALRDLIAKAREKLVEKRKIDHRKAYLTNLRIIARLSLNQVVATVGFDDHLKYHTELQQLGCEFIRDQVSCLDRFNLLSRSDYTHESNYSVLGKEERRFNEKETEEINKEW